MFEREKMSNGFRHFACVPFEWRRTPLHHQFTFRFNGGTHKFAGRVELLRKMVYGWRLRFGA